MKKLMQLIDKQIEQDKLYDDTEKMRDVVDAHMKAGEWKQAALLLQKIDMNMLEITRQQNECMTEFVNVFFLARGSA